MAIPFPEPDPAILAKRDEILRGLAPLVATEAIVLHAFAYLESKA